MSAPRRTGGLAEIAAGQLVSGDFTEPGLGYQIVDLVMATVPIGGCAGPGGPFPTALSVGSNAYELPSATPDPGLACVRAAPLPDNAARVVTMVGEPHPRRRRSGWRHPGHIRAHR